MDWSGTNLREHSLFSSRWCEFIKHKINIFSCMATSFTIFDYMSYMLPTFFCRFIFCLYSWFRPITHLSSETRARQTCSGIHTNPFSLLRVFPSPQISAVFLHCRIAARFCILQLHLVSWSYLKSLPYFLWAE